MMKSFRIMFLHCVGVFCLSVFAVGCGPKVPPSVVTEPEGIAPVAVPDDTGKAVAVSEADKVTLALTFKPGQTSTYKLFTERKKSVEFEGNLAQNDQLKGGSTGDILEMTYSQRVESVNESGVATLRITIKSLKFKSVEKNNVRLDFDSAREEDKKNPLSKLIGKGYKIRVSPEGSVLSVLDTKESLGVVRGNSAGHQIGTALLKAAVVKNRHGITALPKAGNNRFAVGQDWSSVKNVPFGFMGNRSYERIYVLKEIKEIGGKKVGVIQMNAIPTSGGSEIEETTEGLSKMFDNIDIYIGSLELDLADGTVEKFMEELKSEWIIVDPTAQADSDKAPDSLTMTAIRIHKLERID